MSISERLISWNLRWGLKDGTVRCKGCNAEQRESGRGGRFIHDERCKCVLDPDDFPWFDLDEIADNLSRH
jgi:hypothetical protein